MLFREVVSELIEEYQAAERPDYVSWGPSGSGAGAAPADEDSRMYPLRP